MSEYSRIPCQECGIPIPAPPEGCHEPEAFLCDTCVVKIHPEGSVQQKAGGCPPASN